MLDGSNDDLCAWCVGSVREQAVHLGRQKSNHDGGTCDQSMPLGPTGPFETSTGTTARMNGAT